MEAGAGIAIVRGLSVGIAGSCGRFAWIFRLI